MTLLSFTAETQFVTESEWMCVTFGCKEDSLFHFQACMKHLYYKIKLGLIFSMHCFDNEAFITILKSFQSPQKTFLHLNFEVTNEIKGIKRKYMSLLYYRTMLHYLSYHRLAVHIRGVILRNTLILFQYFKITRF